MSDFSRFGETYARQLADLESRKAAEIGAFLGINTPEDARLTNMAAEVMEGIINTLSAATSRKQKEALSTTAMSRSLAGRVLAKLLPPLNENPGAQERELRAEIERDITQVIESIVPAIEICLNPSKPRTEPTKVFGQGRARKRKPIN